MHLVHTYHENKSILESSFIASLEMIEHMAPVFSLTIFAYKFRRIAR